MSWREVISVDIDFSLIKKAYKKLKSSVFYDKTQLILRDKIVEFESCSDNSGENIDEKLKKLFDDIIYPDCRERLKSEILDSIGYHSFPKKLKSSELSIITNTVSNKTEIEETQYFIDMDVRGHIIGVLWLLLIGWRLDKGVYEHSYGNRIRKKLINDFSKNVTFSPNLFEPYYVLYESWRDTALSCARKSLDKSQDVMIGHNIVKRILNRTCHDENTQYLLLRLRVNERLRVLFFHVCLRANILILVFVVLVVHRFFPSYLLK